MERTGGRRRAREHALQMLYQAELAGLDAEATIAAHFERAPESDAAIRAFAERLVRSVLGDLGRLDALLGDLAHHWAVDRMGAVDRNVLRLALGELGSEPETPGAVVIDEAVELAKHFGDVGSGRFVNGILEAARRRLRPDEPASGPAAPA